MSYEDQIAKDKATVMAFYHHQEICPVCRLCIKTQGNVKPCRKGYDVALAYLEYRSRMPGGRQAAMILEWLGKR